jgi:hypothetical protein
MESKRTIGALKALAHRACGWNCSGCSCRPGEDGLTVGSLQASTGHAGATLEQSLNTLRRAGLIRDRAREPQHSGVRAD